MIRKDGLRGVSVSLGAKNISRRRRKLGSVRVRIETDGEVEVVELRPGDSIQSTVRLHRDGEAEDVVQTVMTLLPPTG